MFFLYGNTSQSWSYLPTSLITSNTEPSRMAAKEDPLPSGTMELDASSSINEAQETHPVFEGDLISALPPELALAVFGTLAASDVFALCKAALVCRNWHSLSNDVQIWKMLYWRDFADLVRTYATAWPSWPGTLASAHSSVHFPAPNTALGHVNLELHLDPETNEITADERATLPIHPLTDLTKVPHAVLETVRHRDFLRLLAIRDRHFGLGMRRERVEAAKAAMAMIDLPQSSRADLIALSLAPLPPSLPPAPKFSTLPKLIYFTARKDSRRSVIATAQELARYEIVFRFKDPEEMVPMQPDPDRQIISRFNQEGVYESGGFHLLVFFRGSKLALTSKPSRSSDRLDRGRTAPDALALPQPRPRLRRVQLHLFR